MLHPWFSAFAKGIIEGFTEFLPISSTGHLVLVRHLLPLTTDPARVEVLDNLFDIVIQLPAVLAVVILFRKTLWENTRQLFSKDTGALEFWRNIVIAFLPAGVIGFALKSKLDLLMQPVVVAVALIVGGLILLWVERGRIAETVMDVSHVGWRRTVSIGFVQCLSMIPGTSRSGATIVGGRILGLSRPVAAEFSFYLALPTMVGAFVLKFFKELKHIQWATDGPILLIGSVTSFITAWIVIALFIRFIQKHSLAIFGWYRIALGILILFLST